MKTPATTTNRQPIDPTRIDATTMTALLARGRAERSIAARTLFARLGHALFGRRDGSAYEGLRLTAR